MLKHLLTQTHSVPIFEGDRSRRHRDVPLWRLAARGALGAVRQRRPFAGVDSFVQFVGFPRSGHSLIGSILDAHPEAVVSHELDTMGLLNQRLPERVIYALIAENSATFSRHDRYWNGFSYTVPGGHHGRAEPLRVLGDKKGDWAVRWCEENPELIDDVYRRVRARCRWILVTRHPLDNIATMSLRKNRTYDRLRIEAADSADFKARLAASQEDGEVAAAALDSMIDDYGGLCQTIERMQTASPADDWCHVEYEQFLAHPADQVRRLVRFLDLQPGDDYVASAASIVRESPNKSRNAVTWTGRQLERVEALTRRYPFLQSYQSAPRPHA